MIPNVPGPQKKIELSRHCDLTVIVIPQSNQLCYRIQVSLLGLKVMLHLEKITVDDA